jgi:hypothetical protein
MDHFGMLWAERRFCGVAGNTNGHTNANDKGYGDDARLVRCGQI